MSAFIAWERFPILRYTLFFIAGIGLYFSNKDLDATFLYASGLIALSIGIISHFRTIDRILIGINWLILITICGFIVAKTKDPTQHQNHLVHQKMDDLICFEAKIIDTPTDKTKYSRVLLTAERIIDSSGIESTESKILAYIHIDSLFQQLSYGDRIVVKKKPQRISGAKNPYGFDYGQYLASQDIYHQVFIKSQDYAILESKAGSDFYALSLSIRSYLSEKLRQHISSPRNLAVAEALLLGSRRHLDTETKNAFIDAGAIHVLAVSGLHVGIIYEVLLWLLLFFKKTKKGRQFIFAMTISVLFVYAIITGLSASVLRSVLMFSLLAAAELINRKSNTYNTLALSALILLIIKPDMLFDIGFQMSYAAVFGIVYFYPLLTRHVHFSTKVANWLYQLSCVSISAQITTLPIGLYYFHQFPNYFLLSNPIVIFLVTGILYTGLLFFALSWVPLMAKYISIFAEFLLDILVQAVAFIQAMPGAVSRYISFDGWQYLLTSLIILVIIAIIEKPRKALAFSLGCILIFWSGISLFYGYQSKAEKSLTFYSHDQEFLFSVIENGQIYSNKSIKHIDDPYLKQDLLNHAMFKNTALQPEGELLDSIAEGLGIFTFEGQTFLVTEIIPDHVLPEVDWVVISHLEEVNENIGNFKAKQGFIIAGNIPFYAKRKLNHFLTSKSLKLVDLKEKAVTFKKDSDRLIIL